jgi:hypothetical protein
VVQEPEDVVLVAADEGDDQLAAPLADVLREAPAEARGAVGGAHQRAAIPRVAELGERDARRAAVLPSGALDRGQMARPDGEDRGARIRPRRRLFPQDVPPDQLLQMGHRAHAAHREENHTRALFTTGIEGPPRRRSTSPSP